MTKISYDGDACPHPDDFEVNELNKQWSRVHALMGLTFSGVASVPTSLARSATGVTRSAINPFVI